MSLQEQIIKKEINESLPQKRNGRWTIPTDISIDNYIFDLVRKHGPITRGNLTKVTNIPRTTIYGYLITFVITNKIKKIPISSRKRGRPAVYYQVIKD